MPATLTLNPATGQITATCRKSATTLSCSGSGYEILNAELHLGGRDASVHVPVAGVQQGSHYRVQASWFLCFFLRVWESAR
jgi:hypothetical protein